MKHIILICCLLCINKLFAQQILKGKITDADTKEPLTGVIVTNGTVGTTTNINGEFVLKIPDGLSWPINLQVKLVGYQQKNVSVNQSAEFVAVSLKTANALLSQVMVSAQRNQTNVYKSTASTEVIKPYLIENRITTNLNKVVDQIPSVNVVDGQINIRSGSGWSYGAGSRVLVLLDGMPFLTGDAGQVQWKFLPIENVEQIEVMKGASSVLYGSSALNGMVSLTTKQAGDKPYTSANVFAGYYSKPGGNDVIYPFNKAQKQSGFNFFHASKFGSDKNNSFGIAANYLNDEGYRLGEYDKRLRLNYNIKFKSKQAKPITYGINGGLLFTDGASFLLWESFKERYTALDRNLTITKSTNMYVDPTVTFYTGSVKHDVKSRWLYVNNDVQNPTQDQDNSANLWYADYQLSKYLTGLKLLMVGGATGVYTLSKSPLFLGNNSATNGAVFASVEKYFLKQNTLVVNAGLRYEYFAMNAKGESRPVVRLGANYQAAKYTFLRASYGQGYRFPSIAERYITTSVGALNIFSNPGLRSETGTNTEFGIKQAFALKSLKGFVDAAAFYTTYDNMIEFNFGIWGNSGNGLNDLGFKSLNVGSTVISGYDFSAGLSGNIGSTNIQAIIGYTYTNPQVLNPNQVFDTDASGTEWSFRNTRSDSLNVLKYRVEHLFKCDVQATYKRFMVGTSIRYNSFMRNVDGAFIYLNPFIPDIALGRSLNRSGVWITDIRASYKISLRFTATLAINNLFNIEFMNRPADMGPPRLTMLNIGYKIQ